MHSKKNNRALLQCLALSVYPMMMMMMMIHLSCVSSSSASTFFKPFNVSYDHRAIIIDGNRRMLISAGIHYPRATPEVPFSFFALIFFPFSFVTDEFVDPLVCFFFFTFSVFSFALFKDMSLNQLL